MAGVGSRGVAAPAYPETSLVARAFRITSLVARGYSGSPDVSHRASARIIRWTGRSFGASARVACNRGVRLDAGDRRACRWLADSARWIATDRQRARVVL